MDNIEVKIIEIDRKLDKHIITSEGSMGEMAKEIDLIKGNHLVHLKSSIDSISLQNSTLAERMAVTSTNVEWLAKNYWIIFTASIGGFIAALIKLFIA